MKDMVQAHLKSISISPKSKRWWDDELSTQIERVRSTAYSPQGAGLYKEEKRRLKKMIRKKKKAHWDNFLREHGRKNPWEIVRLARNPFGREARMGDLRSTDGSINTTDEEKVQAFQDHNLIWSEANQQGPEGPTQDGPIRDLKPASEETKQAIRKALARASPNSAPGPDLIRYRLLKLIQDTRLGKELIEQIGGWVDYASIPQEALELRMIMIPKPGKDQSAVNGWRPIVLAQTVGKLADKVVASRLQKLDTFHHLQYGSRTGRSAADSLVLTTSIARRAIANGERATLLGKDIVSAFNHLRKEGVLTSLRETGLEDNFLRYITRFLGGRTFDLD